jgi:hypothetical protein
MTELEIQKKIEELREQWKTATGVNRIIIEKRGVMLKIALAKKQNTS